MSAYEWVIEDTAPDGVTTTIVFDFDETEKSRKGGRNKSDAGSSRRSSKRSTGSHCRRARAATTTTTTPVLMLFTSAYADEEEEDDLPTLYRRNQQLIQQQQSHGGVSGLKSQRSSGGSSSTSGGYGPSSSSMPPPSPLPARSLGISSMTAMSVGRGGATMLGSGSRVRTAGRSTPQTAAAVLGTSTFSPASSPSCSYAIYNKKLKKKTLVRQRAAAAAARELQGSSASSVATSSNTNSALTASAIRAHSACLSSTVSRSGRTNASVTYNDRINEESKNREDEWEDVENDKDDDDEDNLNQFGIDPDGISFAAKVEALARKAQQQRHCMGPPPVSPPLLFSHPSSRTSHPLHNGSSNNNSSDGSAKDVSSFFISPIHQSVAEASSPFAGHPTTSFHFLGHGGLAKTPATVATTAMSASTASSTDGFSGMKASTTATRGLPLSGISPSPFSTPSVRFSAISSPSRVFSPSAVTNEMRELEKAMEGGIDCSLLLPTSTSTMTTRSVSRGGNHYNHNSATVSASLTAGKRSRSRRTRQDRDGDGDSVSSEEEEVELLQRLKRRRMGDMQLSTECGGSRVLAPCASPSLMPPVSLLPSSKADTREDLLRSFLTGAKLEEDDFRLY